MANVTSGDVVQWEITLPKKCVCDGGCPKGFCKRVLFLSNGSFQLYDYNNTCSDRDFFKGDTKADTSRCWPYAKQMYIDHLSGSLKGPNHVWFRLKTEEATAKCSVLQGGCLNDSQPVEIKDDQLCEYVCRLMWSVWSVWSVWSMWSLWSMWSMWSMWSLWSLWSMHCSSVSSNKLEVTCSLAYTDHPSPPESDIYYTKCSPELTDTKETEPVRLLYGSSNHICLSVTLKNNPPVSVAFNGEDVDKTELQLGGEGCEACRTECYENISNELGRGALHAEVVVALWRKNCSLNKNYVVIYIPFTSVNSSDSGNWTIKLPTQSVVYQTSVGERCSCEV